MNHEASVLGGRRVIEYPPFGIWSFANFRWETKGSTSPEASFSLLPPHTTTRSHLFHILKKNPIAQLISTLPKNMYIYTKKESGGRECTLFWLEWAETERSQEGLQDPCPELVREKLRRDKNGVRAPWTEISCWWERERERQQEVMKHSTC